MIETTDRFVNRIAEASYGDLGATDIEKAKIFLLDTLGVGIAGSSGASVPELLNTVRNWGHGDEATVWVTGERVSTQAAAIVNAYQIHCLEYDCVHEGAVVHPMATILSAMLAHAESRSVGNDPVPGRDFLVALAVGIDMATLIGVAATGPIRFFRPATAGGLGAAAAVARNAGRNRAGNVTARAANVFDVLREYDRAGERFDTIVLDPPAFAKNRGAAARALAGYKEINLRALRILSPGGVLVTSSCSYHVDEAACARVLASAAADARADVRVVEKRLQSRDHPVLATVPETSYLKCVVLRRA